MRLGRLLMNAVLLSCAIGIVTSCGTCAYAALRLAGILAKAASAPRPAPRPEPSALVLLRGDLGDEPAPTTLGRGGPPAGVEPPVPLWLWTRWEARRRP